MTIDVFELIGSDKTKLSAAGSGNALGLRYMVAGTESRDEALEAFLAELANSVSLRGGRATVIADSIELDEVAPGYWTASADYVAPEYSSSAKAPKAVGETTFAFDGTGGAHRVFEAFTQTKYGANAPNHGNAIEVNDGKVEGIEIVIPQLAFTVSQRVDGPSITFAWLRNLILATGTVNSDSFLGFAAGEVLFLGPSGQQPFAFMDDGTVAQGERDIEYRFAVSPNLSDLTIGTITGIAKPGHDYLWIQYEETVDDDAKGLTKKPIGVYVAQVYRRTVFANLGISNPFVNFPVAGR